MVDAHAARRRLEARFAPGWPAVVGVPEEWLPHLVELDAQLAALEPDYQLAQVKTKWGGLRYYVEDELTLPCCGAWDRTHPLADDADDEAEIEWESAFEAHTTSAEHVATQAARDAVSARRDELIAAAEADSVNW